jgi:hypothetical protein
MGWQTTVVRFCNFLTAFLVWLSIGIIYIYSLSLAWYGFIMYGGLPRGENPIAVLEPVNSLLVAYLLDPMVVGIVGAAIGLTAIDVRRNGLQLTPDIENPQARQRRLRREWAEKKDVWELPEIDQESPSIYAELRDDSQLELSDTELRETGDWVLRGVVENTTAEPVGRVFIETEFYTVDREAVSSKTLTTDGIEAHGTWVFEAYYVGSKPIRHYSISEPKTIDKDD